ncbi:MAG: ATP-dependent sacrificial sulfur transferase LarE [candidate division WOR-3 bacterium]
MEKITGSKLKKIEKLKKFLRKFPGVVVAFSGGVDSTFLLKIAVDILKDNVIAVTATSPLYPETELRLAKRIAKRLNVKHIVIRSSELENKYFKSNTANRCFYCKLELFKNLKKIAQRNGFIVIEASNYSDLSDFRPGLMAAMKLGIKSPLIAAKITKDEIRFFAKMLKLPNWDKPSMACLASRIPYGVEINKKILRRIERAEGFLKRLEFSQFRVRDHFPIARIEILQNEFTRMIKNRMRIIKFFKKIGYSYITFDLEGYRIGSMNI